MPMTADAITELLGRQAALRMQRQLHETLWQDIADFMLPHASGISTARTPGEKRTVRLFDSTAIDCVTRLASNFQGAMTNPATQWMTLEFEEPGLSGDYETDLWLEDVGQRLRSGYQQSNAYQAFHELYLQLIAFGTGCLYVEERLPNQPGFDGYVFKILPMGTFDLAEGESGQVDTVMAVRRLTARQAAQRFDRDALSEKVRQRLSDGGKRLDETTAYLHVVRPRDEAQGSRSARGLRIARQMPWASCYIDMEDKTLVAESGYEEFPFFVPRWLKTADVPGWLHMSYPDSPWGFGPGHIALPHVKTLNAIIEWGLKALPLHLFPPGVTDDDSVIGRFDFTPGAMNAVRRGASVTPYAVGGNPQLVELKIEQLQQAVKRIFYDDQLAAIPQTPQKTAFEVAQIIEQMQRVMGPTFSRLTTELFDPLANRTFGIRLRAGGFLPPPMAVLLEAAQHRGRIRVKYEGPLARAQRAGEVEAIDRLYSWAGEVVQVSGDQSIYDGLDHQAALEIRAEILGVPKRILRDRRAVAKRQAQREAAQQQQAELEHQVQASKAARNVTPLMQQGVSNAA